MNKQLYNLSAGSKGQEGIQNKAGHKIVQNGEEMKFLWGLREYLLCPEIEQTL